MIQLAVSTYSLARWRKERNKNLVQSLRWLADNDVKGVEFVGVDEADPAKVVRKARSLRRECDKLGLHICGYCTPGELLRDPGEQQQMVEQLKRQVDVAAMLGVKSMRHDVTGGDFTKVKGYKGPTTFAAALKILVPAIREVADYAATQGLKTSLENHGFYMQAPDRVEKLLQTVDHPAFGLTIDMGNFMCVNADPVAAVRQLLPYAIHTVQKKACSVADPNQMSQPTRWLCKLH